MTYHLPKIIKKSECILHSAVPLVLRLLIGYQFLLTGLGKLQHIERTTAFFASLHIPMPGIQAHFIGSLEMIGGAMLMLGLATRVICIPLICTLVVAYLTDQPGETFQSVYDFINAAPFPFFAVTLFLLAFGPGCVSLDRLFQLRFAKCRCLAEKSCPPDE
jgi:putative oxidoreductase